MILDATDNTALSGTEKQSPSWEGTISEFREHLDECERSPLTVSNYLKDLEQLRRWYERSNDARLNGLVDVNAVQLREWKRWMQHERRLATATVNRRLSAAGTLLRWAYHTRRIDAPVERPKLIRMKRLGHRGLDPREERNLLSRAEAGSSRDKAVVVFLLQTGLRVGELAGLTWRDLKLTDRRGFAVVHGKGDKTRNVPVTSRARAALESLGLAEHRGSDRKLVWGERGPLRVRAIQAIVERFGIHAHMLRHTFSHNFRKAGGSLEQLAAILGHEDLETTRRYVEPSAGDLAATMERMGSDE